MGLNRWQRELKRQLIACRLFRRMKGDTDESAAPGIWRSIFSNYFEILPGSPTIRSIDRITPGPPGGCILISDLLRAWHNGNWFPGTIRFRWLYRTMARKPSRAGWYEMRDVIRWSARYMESVVVPTAAERHTRLFGLHSDPCGSRSTPGPGTSSTSPESRRRRRPASASDSSRHQSMGTQADHVGPCTETS
jgi:hypothetical protein